MGGIKIKLLCHSVYVLLIHNMCHHVDIIMSMLQLHLHKNICGYFVYVCCERQRDSASIYTNTLSFKWIILLQKI